jgi:hypothetical protein
VTVNLTASDPDFSFKDGLGTLVASLYEIRRISKKMLDEKLQEADSVSDQDAKRDVMSVLTRARKAEERNTPGCYSMSERVMMDQVVSRFLTPIK